MYALEKLLKAMGQRGADFNTACVDGKTLLSHYVGRENLRMVKMLRKGGVDMTAVDGNGKSAIEVVLQELSNCVEEYLSGQFPGTDRGLFYTQESAHRLKKVFKYLLKAGVWIPVLDSKGHFTRPCENLFRLEGGTALMRDRMLQLVIRLVWVLTDMYVTEGKMTAEERRRVVALCAEMVKEEPE
jgi:hypothetical protein